jgi:hypothetical protein
MSVAPMQPCRGSKRLRSNAGVLLSVLGKSAQGCIIIKKDPIVLHGWG